MKKEMFKFKIDSKIFESEKSVISGVEMKSIAGISPDITICQILDKKAGIEIIQNESSVDLATNGIEKFLIIIQDFSCTLKLNSTDVPWNKQYISYEEVVSLVYGTNEMLKVIITYSHGPDVNPNGNLLAGEIILVKDFIRITADGTVKS